MINPISNFSVPRLAAAISQPVKSIAGTLATTSIGYTAAVASSFVTESLFNIAGNNSGQDQLNQMILQNPYAAEVLLAGIVPVIEETMFRYTPNLCLNGSQMAFQAIKRALSKDHQNQADAEPLGCTGFLKRFFYGDGSPQWGAAMLSATTFALAHSVDVNAAGEMFYNSNFLPVPQLILGLVFWNLMRHKGIHHAILAHMMVNSIAVIGTTLSH